MAKNTPKPSRDNQDVVSFAIQSPIPPSAELKNYDTVCPGAAREILNNFLAESEHRREIETVEQRIQVHIATTTTKNYGRGLIFGLIAVLSVLSAGITFMVLGYPTQGASIICTVIVGLAVAFIYGSRGLKS